MKNQKGFGAVELLLILVAVGLIGGTGWYVYKSQKATNQSLDNASSSLDQVARNKAQEKKEEVKEDETKDWLTFTPRSKFYTLRLPDGWQLVHQTDSDVLYSGQLTYKQGTKAVVEETTGGRDGVFDFMVAVDPEANESSRFSSYQKTGTFKAGSLEGNTYYYEQTEEADGIGLPKGGKEYAYYFVKNGKGLYVAYSLLPGETNQKELVEKALSTLTLN